MTNQEKAEQLAKAEMDQFPDVWRTDRSGARKRLIKEALSILGKPDKEWKSEGKAELAAECIHETFNESWDNSDDNDLSEEE